MKIVREFKAFVAFMGSGESPDTRIHRAAKLRTEDIGPITTNFPAYTDRDRRPAKL